MKKSALTAILIAILTPLGSSVAREPSHSRPVTCKPVISDAWIRKPPGNAGMMAGYLRIDNPCRTSIQLTGVRSAAFAGASVHQTTQVNGVSRMRHLPSLTLAKGDRAIFEPGGLHLMLMQPAKPLRIGDKVSLTLTGPGWSVPVSLTVRGMPN